MPTLRDQAVCVRHWDWSETSQTVSLLTREHGLIRGIAKGSKREKASFSGGIELLTRGEVVAIVKPASELGNITAWDLQETFPALRSSLTAFHGGMYIADVAQHVLHDRDPHPSLFDAVVGALRGLGPDPDGNRRVVLMLQWAALVETGWKPELDRDIVSGAPLASAGSYIFAPALGGFSLDGSVASTGWRVRSETLSLLRSIGRAGVSGERPDSVERASRLLDAYLATVLGRELPSAGAIFPRRSTKST